MGFSLGIRLSSLAKSFCKKLSTKIKHSHRSKDDSSRTGSYLAQSILIDNQDAANAVTVRLNRSVNAITIPPGNQRIFNDAWIEQIDLTGPSTNTQVTAQISPLTQISPYGQGVTN